MLCVPIVKIAFLPGTHSATNPSSTLSVTSTANFGFIPLVLSASYMSCSGAVNSGATVSMRGISSSATIAGSIGTPRYV